MECKPKLLQLQLNLSCFAWGFELGTPSPKFLALVSSSFCPKGRPNTRGPKMPRNFRHIRHGSEPSGLHVPQGWLDLLHCTLFSTASGLPKASGGSSISTLFVKSWCFLATPQNRFRFSFWFPLQTNQQIGPPQNRRATTNTTPGFSSLRAPIRGSPRAGE